MTENYNQIPKEKFTFVHEGERISDKKFNDKPIGYFKDAWIRFRKNRASVVAAFIIIFVVLYAFVTPLLITTHDGSFMVNQYSRKPARVTWLRDTIGILDGGADRQVSEQELIRLMSIGLGAADYDGTGASVAEGMDNYCQPLINIGERTTTLDAAKREVYQYSVRVDCYLEEGFIYRQITQSELANIQAFEEETGLKVLYPLIEKNEFNADPTNNNANYWYKTWNTKTGKANPGYPVSVDEDGTIHSISYGEDMVLEDNYKRDADGNPIYYEYYGGGSTETAALRIRVLYYNYYQYLYGFEPNYIMGTESQGYDMALRIAGGIKLSLMIAISVSVINFILGALYGAVEGYYGGVIDLVLERVSDILNGVPFIIVATLFQIHLAKTVGSLVCLLFAYVMTGWIGTAYRVRSQFYRFKNQEYVMAARTLGARDRRIIWKHIFPNTLGTLITSSALVIPSTIMSESMLSFLGIVQLGGASGTSLGTLLSDAESRWINFPHLMLYPALVISLLMISFNLFGNGLRDAFNPALRGVEE